MQLVIVGLNHASARLDVRERVAFAGDELRDALERLRAIVDEGFILSTCNRVEVYGLTGHAESGADALLNFLVEGHNFSAAELEPFTYAYAHEDAVRHLFRVAGGVDSMVLGESEILGQLRRALQVASQCGALGSTLGRLGAAAVRAGRQARTLTGLGTGSVSLVSLGLRAAMQRGVSATNSDVAVLGGGEIAETVLRHLAHARPRSVTIAGRGIARTQQLAALYGVRAARWDERAGLIAGADLVVACTSAAEPVLRANDMLDRGTRRLVCVDLGVPRDIDPAVRALSGVTVVNIDELESLAAENRARHVAEADRAEALLSARAEQFMEWWRARQVVPTITDLRAYGATIRDAELERALARLPRLTDDERRVVGSLGQRIVGKLLHGPLTMVKHDAEGANMAQVLRYLFQLDDAPQPGNGPFGTSRCAEETRENLENQSDGVAASDPSEL